MAKKRTTLAPKITDYTSSLAGYDLYGYEDLKHQTTFFCYRFPAEHLKQAKRALRNLAYGGFLIEVWTFNYSTERQIAYYDGNPELRPKPLTPDTLPDLPNLPLGGGIMLPTNPPKYKHFTLENGK